MKRRLPFFLDSVQPLPYNLPLTKPWPVHGEKTTMRVSNFRFRLTIVAMLALPALPLPGSAADQSEWVENRESWGRVIFCQHIYKLPEVRVRLYDFDIEQCDKAGQLMHSKAAAYSDQQQVELKNQAERHASLLSRNTSDPYQSVVACREYCSELAEIQDRRND